MRTALASILVLEESFLVARTVQRGAAPAVSFADGRFAAGKLRLRVGDTGIEFEP